MKINPKDNHDSKTAKEKPEVVRKMGYQIQVLTEVRLWLNKSKPHKDKCLEKDTHGLERRKNLKVD